MIEYGRVKEEFTGSDMPLAFVDLAAFEGNADAVAEASDDLEVRVVTKSLRCRRLIERLLERDSFEDVMCYSGYEAAWLLNSGVVDDALVAYPIANPDEIEAAADADATLMVDSIEHLELIEDVAADAGVCIDLDVSSYVAGQRVGALRSSLTPEEARDLAVEASERGLEVRGVMGYDAQIAGLPDRTPNRSKLGDVVVEALKNRSWQTVVEKREAVRSYLEDAGFRELFYNGGGTGSLHLCSGDPALTEAAVGSAFYYPALFSYHDTVELEPAAAYCLEVTRQPEPDVYTVRGGGYTASGPVGPDKEPQPHLPEEMTLSREGAGEVQTPVETDVDLELGDPVVFRHAKAGELCERFRELYLVDGDEVQSVDTYRGEGRCFM